MNTKGFTLIELLIVIIIISGLATLGIYLSNSWFARSRDARRIQDINHMRTAFEQHVSTTDSYSIDSNCADIFSNTKLFPDGAPVDPDSSKLLELSDYYTTCTETVNYKYCLCAELEQQNGNSNNYDCVSYDTSGDEGFYCVSNIN